MKRTILIFVTLSLLLTSLLVVVPGYTQGKPPFFALLGRIDTKSDPQNAKANVSVIDPNTGQFIEGLGADSFVVQVADETVALTGVNQEVSGIAVAIVIDRGGIGRDRRKEQAVDLTDRLLARLNIDGSENADMVSLIGIRGRDDDVRVFEPLVPFTDYDPNVITNEFDALRTENVPEVTPLYDGLDQAIEWLTQNPTDTVQQKLDQRRKVIVVFSDGIDRQYSSEAHETIIINKCNDNNISIYAIRMSAGTGDADNMEALAKQTAGQYLAYRPGEEVDAAVNVMFDELVKQRQSYLLTFPAVLPKGSYDVDITVKGTGLGDASVEGLITSGLVKPNLVLVPPAQNAYTVPYSRTLKGYPDTWVTLSTQISFPDNVERMPGEVHYYANGTQIGTGTPPDYTFNWNLGTLVTPTHETQQAEYTLVAQIRDEYLGENVVSDQSTIKVQWELQPRIPWELIFGGIGFIALIALTVMLVQTRGQLKNAPVVQKTTGFLKKATQRLTPGGQNVPAFAKLIVTRGMNTGNEFRISAPLIKVSRDPQFGDFALYDQFVSNPHFSIRREQSQFFIVDEKSTNTTRVNGSEIPPLQQVPLPPDSIIEAGNIQMQFKRIGGATRSLNDNSGQPHAQQQAGGVGGGGAVDPNQPRHGRTTQPPPRT